MKVIFCMGLRDTIFNFLIFKTLSVMLYRLSKTKITFFTTRTEELTAEAEGEVTAV